MVFCHATERFLARLAAYDLCSDVCGSLGRIRRSAFSRVRAAADHRTSVRNLRWFSAISSCAARCTAALANNITSRRGIGADRETDMYRPKLFRSALADYIDHSKEIYPVQNIQGTARWNPSVAFACYCKYDAQSDKFRDFSCKLYVENMWTYGNRTALP